MSEKRRGWLASLWILMVAMPIGFASVTQAEDADDIFFHDDYNKALREAKLTQKPIFLEFRCEP